MAKRAYSTKPRKAAKRYDSDLTDQEWALIEPELAQKPGRGRRRTVNIREVVNAVFYLVRTGCQWRMLPKEFPDYRHVWYYWSVKFIFGGRNCPHVGHVDPQNCN